uniref:60S ribosomal export protein NMD3-like n=1 Tax=Crassostrea virginica TaxID=6565 RepID=A0A8B8E0R8_CRAVI|nr:60S ribosomal export protein NMD3-like [Crassostrea virginica]
MADLWVSKVTESGLIDHQYFCRTHLGHLLSPGDTVYGFDFTNANLNNPDLEKVKAEKLPDVVVVKKVFGDKTTRNRKRRWKLKHLHDDLHMETASNERDYTDFLEDLEEDQTTRQHVNIYKDQSKIAVDTTDTEDEDLPQISLQEMLDDLHIADDPMGDED